MVELGSLDIRRLIVHHIPKAVNKELAIPVCGTELIELPPAGLDMFSKRIAAALGHSSKGIKVDIVREDASSFFQCAAQMMQPALGDAEFIEASKLLAKMLCEAQGIRNLSASKLIVMAGVTGEFQRPFLSVIKADMQDALAEVPAADGVAVVSYLDNIFLTEAQRLFKIGFLMQGVANPRVVDELYQADDYAVHLFDHLLTMTESRNAAHYFYSGFLGMDVAASDRRLTQDFYEKTLRFFESRSYDTDELIAKSEALRTELRSNDATISVADFASKHLADVDAIAFEEYMRGQAFPEHAITKDVDYIKAKIKKRRRMVFSSQVVVTAPGDGDDLISIDSTDNGQTTVVISGTLTKSE